MGEITMLIILNRLIFSGDTSGFGVAQVAQM